MILLDIDDVLAGCVDGIRRSCQRAGLAEVDWPVDYQFSDWPEAHRLLARQRIADPLFYRDLEPITNARTAAWALNALRPIAYVTARGSGLDQLSQATIAHVTTRWLHKQNFPTGPIHYAHSIPKGLLARMHYSDIDFAIDDAPHAAEAYAEQGIFTCLLDRPYNRHIEEGPLIRRVQNLTQALTYWFGNRQALKVA